LLILIFRFEDIRIGNNVSPTDYQIFLEKRGVRPFGFYTEWINRSVYIVDVALPPHERTIGKFFRSILRSLQTIYKRKLFIFRGTPTLEFGNRCAAPDFSFSIARELIRSKFIVPNYGEIPTIVGEVAYSQSLDSLLKKSQQYIQDLSADIVIAVKVPKPTIVKEESDDEIEKLTIAKGELEAKLEKPAKTKGKLEAPTEVYLYIFYKNVLEPEPITVPFGQEFTFQLRIDALERKIRKKLRAELQHQSDSIDVTIMLKKDERFEPLVLDPDARQPETSESENSESERSKSNSK